MLDEKRRLDAKRFATVRKKIGAISRAASIRRATPPGSGTNCLTNSSHEKNNSDSEDSEEANGMTIHIL